MAVEAERNEGEVGVAADEDDARRQTDAAAANVWVFRRFKTGRACCSIHRPVLVRMGVACCKCSVVLAHRA
jgi:hypothetical protein